MIEVAFPSGEMPSTGSRVLDDVAGVIGVEAAFRLGFEYRGERLYVPKEPARHPRIAEAIGSDLAAEFCATFGGTTITLPTNVVIERKVMELVALGAMTKREIARELRIREARVYEILRREEERKRQPVLL